MRREWLTALIKEVHAESRGTYGSRRVHAELTKGRDVWVSERLVAVLMQKAGIAGLPGPAKVKRIKGIPTADDLVQRKFARSANFGCADIERHEALLNRSTGSVPNYAPAASPRLRRRPSSWPLDWRHQPVEEFSVRKHRCAQQPSPHPSGSSWWVSLEGLSNAGSLPLHLSVLLAGPRPSNGAGPSRLCRGGLPSFPSFQGSDCLQLHQPAATSWWRGSCTPSRFKSASWRSVSPTQASPFAV